MSYHTPSLSKFAVSIGNEGTSNTVYHYNLMGSIGDASDYTDLLNTLRSASEADEIHIHINSPGGQVYTAVQIVNAIENCKGTVIGIIESACDSAAIIVFLACDGWCIEDNTLSLFHQYSAGFYGEGHKVKSQIEATDKWIAQLNRHYYSDFLTEDELELMFNGKDYWFNSDEMRERIERLVKAKTEKVEAFEKAKQKETIENAKKMIKNLENTDDSGDNS